MRTFIGVDIGTTGIRAGVYDESFSLLGSATGRSLVKRGTGGEIVQYPDDIYSETAKAVRHAVEQARADVKSVACLSFDGQMAGIMGIDADWNAVTPYDSWLDTRCSSQVTEIDRRAAGLVAQKTGNIPSYNHGPKILWWKEERGEVYKRIHRFIQPAAYVGGRLCGLRGDDAFIDWTYLHFSGFADNRSLSWDEELTGMFEVSQAKLPRIVSPMTIIGHIEEKEAVLFGIPAGTPVAAGCGDTASCFIGTGAVEVGIAVDVAGTASVFALTTDRFLADPGGMVYTARSVLEDTWYSMSYINGGGLNLEWFNENFGGGRSLQELNESIEGLNPGSDGLIFVPHLEGRAYPNTPTMRGHWMGFTRSHTAAHFFRSILEGIGYEYALYTERIEKELGGKRSYIVRGVGGGSESEIWAQIKADILNCNYCTINREDISVLGQALIAAAAVGHIRDLRSSVKGIIKIDKTYHPNKNNHAVYTEYVSKYRKLLDWQG